ncbi:MAG TPA: PilZ domain-containing protein [Rhizomicrobium sp.]
MTIPRYSHSASKREPDFAALAFAMMADREKIVTRTKPERRRFLRAPVNLTGRLFMPAAEREERCHIVEMSPGGVQVTSDYIPQADEHIIVYIEGFGRFEGVVVRPTESGFAVDFHCSALKRERVAERLTGLMNNGPVDQTILRRHERTQTRGLARFTRANGEIVACEVLDLSLGGLSLKTQARPSIGEVVLIGQMAGKVVRYHENGFAIEFVNGQDGEQAPAAASIARQ